MYTQQLSDGGHNWEKQNLVTLFNNSGQYDIYKCRDCGITGKSQSLGTIHLKGTYSKSKVQNCPGRNTSKLTKIKITYCHANGKVFENLTPGSEHEIVTPPKGYKNYEGGVWVMGVGEPVKVLNEEFEFI